MSIFTNIKRQIVRSANEADVTGIDDISFTVKGKYFPSAVINWFYRNGIFAVKEVQKNNRYEYTVSIKDLDREHPLFKDSGLRGRLTKDADDGFGYRYYTSDDTTSINAYRHGGLEPLDLADDVLLELKLQECDFDNIYDFYRRMGETLEARSIIEEMRQQAYEQKAPEWSYMDEDEEVEA